MTAHNGFHHGRSRCMPLTPDKNCLRGVSRRPTKMVSYKIGLTIIKKNINRNTNNLKYICNIGTEKVKRIYR